MALQCRHIIRSKIDDVYIIEVSQFMNGYLEVRFDGIRGQCDGFGPLVGLMKQSGT